MPFKITAEPPSTPALKSYYHDNPKWLAAWLCRGIAWELFWQNKLPVATTYFLNNTNFYSIISLWYYTDACKAWLIQVDQLLLKRQAITH